MINIKRESPKNSKKRWPYIIFGGLFLVCFLIWILPNFIFWVRYRNQPIAAQVGGIADCIWSASVQSWVDMNGNGLRDAGDQPLPGVTFHVDDTLNGYSNVANEGNATDSKGEAQLSVWLPGCPNARFEIYSDLPSGYRALSNVRPTVNVETTDQTFEFGFSQVLGVSTITPIPPPPTCTSFRLGYSNRYDITDIAVTTDGTVWVATFNDGLRKLSPGNSEWEYIKKENGLVHNQVRSITSFEDGSVWFGTDGGSSRLSSDGWTSFSTTQGLVNNNVYDIAVAQNGDPWFATFGGISHLDIKTGEWNNMPSDMITHTIGVSPSGVLWAGPFIENNIQAITSDPNNSPIDSRIYFSYADQLEFTPNGIIWIAGHDGIGKYDPATEILNIYNSVTTNGSFVDYSHDLAIAQDGSIWIAAGTYTPTVYHFIPWLDTTTASAWQKYDYRDGLPTLPSTATNNDTVHAVAIAPSGDIWIATTEHATRCHFDE